MIPLPLIDTLGGLIGKVIDRVIPDPVAAAEMKLKVAQMQQNGELATMNAEVQLATSQTDINKVEAASDDRFVSGWRPFIGWVCGLGCAWNWIGLPVAVFLCAVFNHPLTLQKADISEMMPLIFGMLGLGAMRTYEKKKGVA